MKKVSLFLAVLLAAVSVSGCVPTEQAQLDIAPDFSKKENVTIDFLDIHNDTLDAFTDRDLYAFVTDVEITGSSEDRQVTAAVGCAEGTTEEQAAHFASALAKNIASAAVNQSSEFSVPGPDSFGDFWNSYEGQFLFYYGEEEEPFCRFAISGGQAPGLDPHVEEYEEECRRQQEIAERNKG